MRPGGPTPARASGAGHGPCHSCGTRVEFLPRNAGRGPREGSSAGPVFSVSVSP